MKPMTKTMMTYSRDQVSGGCRGLVVIGRHAQANRDLKHDEANGRDDVDDGDDDDGDGDDDEEEEEDGMRMKLVIMMIGLVVTGRHAQPNRDLKT